MNLNYIYPEFRQIIVRDVKGKRLSSKEDEPNFILEKNIELSFFGKESPAVLLTTIKYDGSLENKNSEDKIFEVSALYEAYFVFEVGIEEELILKQLESADYQYAIFAQAYTAATQKFLKLVSDFGINSSKIKVNLIPKEINPKPTNKKSVPKKKISSKSKK